MKLSIDRDSDGEYDDEVTLYDAAEKDTAPETQPLFFGLVISFLGCIVFVIGLIGVVVYLKRVK